MALNTDLSKIPVEIPGSYIKEKEIDLQNETFSFLGSAFYVSGFSFRVPSMGVMSLLETFESKFITMDGANITDMIYALYVNDRREDVVDDVCDWYNTGMEVDHKFSVEAFAWAHLKLPFFDLDKDPESWVKSNESATDIALAIHEKFILCHTGFEMIPSGGGSGNPSKSNGPSSQELYGAESMGGILSTCGSIFGCSWHDLLWNVPLTAIGHVLAAEHVKSGTDGVARPKCPDDIKKQITDAKEKVVKGELFQWQIDRPLEYILSDVQKKHSPGLQKKFDALVKKAQKERDENG